MRAESEPIDLVAADLDSYPAAEPWDDEDEDGSEDAWSLTGP